MLPPQKNDSARTAGFTLLEIVAVVAIIAGLAAVLIPALASEVIKSEETKVRWQCKRIATAINQYVRDVRHFPTGQFGIHTYHYLIGNGNEPGVNTFASGPGALFSEFLCDGTANGGDRWKGPYIQDIEPDAWGNAYLLNSHGYFTGSNEIVWVLSAGPNGKVDTDPTCLQLQGDDLGILMD